MKSVLMVAVIVVGVVAFRIGGQLSPDALGMAVGAALAIMGMITVTLMILASQRRTEPQERRAQPPKPIEQPQAPQITNNVYINELHIHTQPQRAVEPAFPQGEPARAYRIIGQLED